MMCTEFFSITEKILSFVGGNVHKEAVAVTETKERLSQPYDFSFLTDLLLSAIFRKKNHGSAILTSSLFIRFFSFPTDQKKAAAVDPPAAKDVGANEKKTVAVTETKMLDEEKDGFGPYSVNGGQLKARNIIDGAIITSCKLCDGVDETADHLFLQCPVAVQVWEKLANWIGGHEQKAVRKARREAMRANAKAVYAAELQRYLEEASNCGCSGKDETEDQKKRKEEILKLFY
ncbi:hypothetical protein OROMI_027318 [Orobanche minor]